MFGRFGLMNSYSTKGLGRLIPVSYYLSNDWMERLRGKGTFPLTEESIAKFG